MSRELQAIVAAYQREGVQTSLDAKEAVMLRQHLLSQPAYLDPKSHEHDSILDSVKFLYEATVPEVE